jgi:hypothetical protein
MAAAIALRGDYESAQLRELARSRRTPIKCGGCWLWHWFMTAAREESPELNPTENIWQYLRDNWLPNRVFTSGRDIVNHCCDAWNRLIDQP